MFLLRPRQGKHVVTASVCLRAYLRNYTSDLHQFLCILPMSVARCFSGGIAIRYVLPVQGRRHTCTKRAICSGAGVTLEQPASLMVQPGG